MSSHPVDKQGGDVERGSEDDAAERDAEPVELAQDHVAGEQREPQNSQNRRPRFL